MEPRCFYRVQSGRSFTLYDEQDGFEARGQYYMDYSHWLNKAKIERHLDWSDRSFQLTPFISVFNNRADAERRAGVLLADNHDNVFIVEILVPSPQLSTLATRFSGETVQLPVLLHQDQNGTTKFISTADARQYLRVGVNVSQLSEWFALDPIPRAMFSGIKSFNQESS